MDMRPGATSDIYAQRVDAGGNTMWAANGEPICTVPGSNEWFPVIASNYAGGATMAWRDDRAGVANANIYAQEVDAGGARQWAANGVPICTAADNQWSCRITSAGDQSAIITWEDWRPVATSDIYAQRVDTNGNPQWTPDGVAIRSIAGSSAWSPRITDGDAGGAIIAWQDDRSGNVDIYSQNVDAGGNTLWAADGVAVSAAPGNRWNSRLVGDGDGGAIVAWEDDRSGNGDIYTQRVDSTGNTMWTAAGVAVCAAAGDQFTPVITTDDRGGAIITWEDVRSGTTSDIYAQRVDSIGDILWTADGVAACGAADNQFSPAITTDGRGGAIIAWQDDRVGAADPNIYAQRVSDFAQTWYLAEGSTFGGFETWVLIQNSGTVPANVTLTYQADTGAVAGPTLTVAPGTRQTVEVAQTVQTYEVSTLVTSDEPVIAERAMYYNNRRCAHDSIGVCAPAPVWFLAEGSTGTNENGTFETWVLVQNPGVTPATVTLTYQTDTGPVPGPTQTIQPGSRESFEVSQTVQTFEVSTLVTADQPVIAERAMYWSTAAVNRQAAHDSIGVTRAFDTWFLAEGSTGTNAEGTFETWVLVQNPGLAPATVTLTYQTDTGAVAGPTRTIQPGSRESFNVADTVKTFQVSTLVTSDEPVIAERAMYWNTATVNRQAAHDSIGFWSY